MAHKRIAVRSGRAPWESLGSGSVCVANLMGTNTGNFVFSDATHVLLTTAEQETVSSRYFATPECAGYYNDHFDHFVLPLANAFRPSFRPHLQALTALIERLTIPVTVLGVGAQVARSRDFAALDGMAQDVRKFMDAVLARSPSVGVRGEVTYEYLTGLGYRDVEVIGCPSMFTFGRELPATRAVHSTADARVALNVSPYVTGVGGFVADVMDTFSDVTYVMQDLPSIKALITGQPRDPGPYGPDVPAHAAHPLMASGVAFLGAAAWIDGLQGYSMSVGTRIHGTIAAVLAGLPVALLAHDSRTEELARYFEIPHMGYHPGVRVADVLGLMDSPSSAMHGNHKQRYEHFEAFTTSHGLSLNPNPAPVRGTLDDVVRAGGHPWRYRIANPRVAWDLARAMATTPGRWVVRR